MKLFGLQDSWLPLSSEEKWQISSRKKYRGPEIGPMPGPKEDNQAISCFEPYIFRFVFLINWNIFHAITKTVQKKPHSLYFRKNIIYLHSFSSNLSLSHIDVTNVKISGLTSISQIWNVLEKQTIIYNQNAKLTHENDCD